MSEQTIGFIGFAGSGKDTAAAAMLTEFQEQGRKAHIDSFAAPIRQISQAAGLDPYDRRYKEEQQTFALDRFCDAFQYGIDTVLRDRLFDHERADLYAFTMEALRPFIWADWDGGRITLSPREFMQVLGTEGGQRVYQHLWVDLAEARWSSLPGTVLVPDVRFEHELGTLDACVVTVRPGIEPVNYHVSEHMAAWLSLGRDIEDKTGHPVRQKFLWLLNDDSKEHFEAKAQQLARDLIQEGAG